jgi:putative YphP/YqiW family bacilliredoxin
VAWFYQYFTRLNFCSKFAFFKKRISMYPTEIVMPMKAELTDHGFEELTTPEEVESALKSEGTTLVMINSVCGCAAGAARPAVIMALHNTAKQPDKLTTSFAGYDIAAVNKIRQMLLPYPPSSPSIALFKDGELVHMIERHQIEGRPAEVIARNLIAAFETYC